MSDEELVTPDFLAPGRLEAAIRQLGIDLIGTSIGVYHITELLGAGGMGEVYRATDTKLHRDVAIKVLPDRFVRDAQRLARFTREAQTLASLNHPNIAQIYGLEESNGVRALVMELVEGEDLSQYIARGPIPIDEALPIAKQIAEALEAAHEQGIIHRDLKPANIKVTPDGAVKVLDFGLAKLAPGGATAGPSDVTASPTITSPAMMTGVGVLLGTAAYMSPEQAKGREADKRSDIWAFGCVLYEMLTGKRPFDGEDVSDTLANVLKREPDLSVLPADIPAEIRTLLQCCLVKEARERIGDIAVVQFLLNEHSGFLPGYAAAPRIEQERTATRVLSIAASMLLTAVAVGAGAWFVSRPVPTSLVATAITMSEAAALARHGGDRDLAITSDGSRIVYRGNNQLIVRALDRLEPTVLTGLGTPRSPFISTGGESIGFFDGNTLRRVSMTGGPPSTITAVDGPPRGATWGPDATIIFATDLRTTGLQSVADSGGEPTVLTTPDRERGEGDHRFPEFLPGGKAVLFTITSVTGGVDGAHIAVLDLRTGSYKNLMLGGSHAYYVPTGHLLYGVSGTLRAVPFDLQRLEVVGPSAPVRDGVATTFLGAVDAVVAANGSLAYIPGVAGAGGRQTVISVDRQRRRSLLRGIPVDSYRDVRVSPDGKRLALATQDDIWIYDFVRESPIKLTADLASGTSPLWTRDSERIIFTSKRAGYPQLFSRRADGTGSDEPVLTLSKDLRDLLATGWSKDGTKLLFTEVPQGPASIGHVTLTDPSTARPLVKSGPWNEHATVSPNGHWMAYQSLESGRPQIFVDRYPELGRRQPISIDGGRLPLWGPDGRTLFFSSLDGRQMFVVQVEAGTTLAPGRPREWFDLPTGPSQAGGRPYDITRGGEFVILRSGESENVGAAAPHIILLQHWFDELKRLVPTR